MPRTPYAFRCSIKQAVYRRAQDPLRLPLQQRATGRSIQRFNGTHVMLLTPFPIHLEPPCDHTDNLEQVLPLAGRTTQSSSGKIFLANLSLRSDNQQGNHGGRTKPAWRSKR
jgi:hypothetical protein